MTKIRIFPTGEETITNLGALFISLAVEQINQKEIFTVALSGGSTPKSLYEFLAQDSTADDLPWIKSIFSGVMSELFRLTTRIAIFYMLR